MIVSYAWYQPKHKYILRLLRGRYFVAKLLTFKNYVLRCTYMCMLLQSM